MQQCESTNKLIELQSIIQYSLFQQQHQECLKAIHQCESVLTILPNEAIMTLPRPLIEVEPQRNLIRRLIERELEWLKVDLYFKMGRWLNCLQSARSYLNAHHSTQNNLNNHQSLNAFSMSGSQAPSLLLVYNVIIKCALELEDHEMSAYYVEQLQKKNHELKEFLQLSKAVQMQNNNYQQYELPFKDRHLIQQLEGWLQQSGSTFRKIKVLQLGSKYRGAITTKAIHKKEKFIFIPRRQLITLEMAKKTPIAKQLMDNHIELLSPKHTLISILIMDELRKKEQSEWYLYLELLPKDHSAFPINFSTQELTELIGSNFLFQIKEKVMDLKRDYDIVCYTCEQFCKYTFREFCWARMTVGSRVFGLNIDGLKTQALVPFADMLNHKSPKQTFWNYSDSLQGFFIESLQEFLPGQQVFDSYGKKCNSRFLLNYGFVLENNEENTVCFKIELNKEDKLLGKKIAMVGEVKDSPRVFRATKQLDYAGFFEMMGYLRFKNIDSLETLTILERISGIRQNEEIYHPSRTPPVSVDLELKVWAQFQQLCAESLKGYSTGIQADQNILRQNPDLSQNMRNIVILRLGEKNLLQYFLSFCQQACQILSKGRQSALEYLADKCSSKDDYLRKTIKLLPRKPGSKTDGTTNSPQLELMDSKEKDEEMYEEMVNE